MPATELTFGVTLAVLAAALLHAGWNALLKAAPGGDPLLDMASVVAGSSVTGMAVAPFVGFPDAAAWKFAAASTAIHFGYYVTLAQAYRTGDLSFAYPLMRGTAPLLVTILGVVFLGEWPSVQGAVGIALISLGIVSIALLGTPLARRAVPPRGTDSRPGRPFALMRRSGHPPAAAAWALTNAVIIALYTLVDGAGARASNNPASYVVWLTILEAVPFLGWILLRRGPAALTYLRHGWRHGLAGGAASLAAYGIVLWAMTRAPVAAVAALRETSVLFAALIGALWLKEGFTLPRLAGAASVVLGIAALKL